MGAAPSPGGKDGGHLGIPGADVFVQQAMLFQRLRHWLFTLLLLCGGRLQQRPATTETIASMMLPARMRVRVAAFMASAPFLKKWVFRVDG